MFVSSISVVTPMDEKSTSRVRSEVAVIGGGVDINLRLVVVRRTDEPATIRTANCHGRIVEPCEAGTRRRLAWASVRDCPLRRRSDQAGDRLSLRRSLDAFTE
jgi:hypothetical protein